MIWLKSMNEELVNESTGSWATENLFQNMSGFNVGMCRYNRYGLYRCLACRYPLSPAQDNLL